VAVKFRLCESGTASSKEEFSKLLRKRGKEYCLHSKKTKHGKGSRRISGLYVSNATRVSIVCAFQNMYYSESINGLCPSSRILNNWKTQHL
jgi:hypothetical protein